MELEPELTAAIDIVPNFINVGPEPSRHPSGPPVVLFVGSDSPHKGQCVALDAFSQLPPGEAQLHLVGGDAPVNRLGVTARGYLRGDALRKEYEAASLLVVPSVWPEPCPTVVLEAMAHGLPVVGSRIGGIPDLIEHGYNGLLVAPNDSVALADGLLAILTDDALRQRLSAAARTRVSQFDAATVLPQIEDVYTSALPAVISA